MTVTYGINNVNYSQGGEQNGMDPITLGSNRDNSFSVTYAP